MLLCSMFEWNMLVLECVGTDTQVEHENTHTLRDCNLQSRNVVYFDTF